MLVRAPESRPPRSIDYAARLVTLALPGRAAAKVDQARRDLSLLADAARGHRPAPVATLDTAVQCAPALSELDTLDALPGFLAGPAKSARRDVRVLVDALVYGRRPPPLVKRGARHRESGTAQVVPLAGSPSLTVSRRVKVVRVERETKDAVSLYLSEVDGHPLRFRAGQFMSVDVVVDGVRLRRAYSLAAPASGPGSDAPHITVKRVHEGRVSNQLNDHAHEGMLLDVLGPSGSFVLEPKPSGAARHLLFVAGGSGITPIVSLVATALHDEPEARVTLVYGNRAEQDVIFMDRLAALLAAHPGRLVVDHVLSDPSSAWEGARGLLDGATLGGRLDALGVQLGAVDQCFVCGPTPMMDAARALLLERGFEKGRLHEERFGQPEARTEARGATTPQPLTLKRGQSSHKVVVQPSQTLLDAALAAGEAMPFSCAMGGCGACKMICLDGEVAMEEPNCLSDDERAAGYVLTCVGRPCGPVTLTSGGSR
ncbi:MAG: ferredoxin--NADP reductase [Sandaracinaceae bacterium]|nr:ferredoxin--NADP reductase [Sandaracinaceae bacterium]